MSVTVGSFLREKAYNMSVWLRAEGLQTVSIGDLQEVQVVALAQMLHDKFADAIEARSFDTLLEDKENVPLDVLRTVSFVQKQPSLHDKFWRYLKLFSDTVNDHE
jgi:hypothetical protein